MVTALYILMLIILGVLFFTQPIWVTVAAAISVSIGWGAFQLLRRRVGLWRGSEPHDEPLVFLNSKMAVRPTVLGHALPEGYRLACLYFGVGLIDRTMTLDHGFHYKVLDPISKDAADPGPIHALCAARARAIVDEARISGKTLRLLWSWGDRFHGSGGGVAACARQRTRAS